MIRLFLTTAIVAAGFATAATAASNETLRVCSGVEARSPAAGATIEAGRPTFRWTAEPKATARREIYLVTLPGGTSETLAAGKPFRFHSPRPTEIGNYTWFVVFYDSEGAPLCRSRLVAFSVVRARPGRSVVDAAIFGSSFSSNPAPAPAAVTVAIVNNRVVIVLQNSPYTGPRDIDVGADVLPQGALVFPPAGKIGFEIHGNNNPNFIYGSFGDDLIYGYGGNDSIDGSLGNDTLYGGPGNDTISDPAPGDTDTIYGGPDMDTLSVADGDIADTLHYDPGDVPPFTDNLALEGSPGDPSP